MYIQFAARLIQKFESLTYTVKLMRAKLPASAANFNSGLHVKRPHTQFTCITCSLPAQTGKLPASTRQEPRAEYTWIACSRM